MTKLDLDSFERTRLRTISGLRIELQRLRRMPASVKHLRRLQEMLQAKTFQKDLEPFLYARGARVKQLPTRAGSFRGLGLPNKIHYLL